MTIDESDLEAMHALELRLDRDDERERIDKARVGRKRRPRYSRFRTLAGMTSLWKTTPSVAEPKFEIKEAA